LEARWRHMLGVLPSPLWGGVGGGGRAIFRRWHHRHLASPPLPQPAAGLPASGKFFSDQTPAGRGLVGGGSRPSVLRVSPLALSVRVERCPIAGSFAISRGAKTEAVVVVAELSDGIHRGRGECVPYARYGETVEGVAAAIAAVTADIARGLDRERLQSAMPAGAARHPPHRAVWGLPAQRARPPGPPPLRVPAPQTPTTPHTISPPTPAAL